MRYEYAPDLQVIAEEIVELLFPHIQIQHVKCLRGYGSSSKYTLARCHALGKLMQKALHRQAFYAIEFLAENFDKLDREEQIKIIIHELMHIPKTFGGGFKHHDYVCEKNINKCYKKYKELKKLKDGKDEI